MRLTAAFVAVVFVCFFVSVSALSAARADVHPYIDAGAEHQYAVLRAPVPAQRFGELSVDTLARARAFFDRGGPTPRVDAAADAPWVGARGPFLGGASGGIPWKVPAPTPAWSAASPAPFGAPLSRKRSAECRTLIGDVERERIAALYLRRTFRVGTELTSLRVLELRARYEDGLVAWINGVEVVRVAVDPRGSVDGVAARSRGPEWETFFLDTDGGVLRAGDNELIVEVRPSVARLAPSVDVALVGRTQARIVRGPLILRTTVDSAIIAFETDVPTRGEVRWGRGASRYEHKVASDGMGTRHEVTLTDLPRGAEIHYQVVADDDASRTAFTTPGSGRSCACVLVGDVRAGTRGTRRSCRISARRRLRTRPATWSCVGRTRGTGRGTSRSPGRCSRGWRCTPCSAITTSASPTGVGSRTSSRCTRDRRKRRSAPPGGRSTSAACTSPCSTRTISTIRARSRG